MENADIPRPPKQAPAADGRGAYEKEAVVRAGVDMSTFANTRVWRIGSLSGHVLNW